MWPVYSWMPVIALMLIKWNKNYLDVDQLKQHHIWFWSSETAKFELLIIWNNSILDFDQVIWFRLICWSSEMTIIHVGQVKWKMLIMWNGFNMCWSSDTEIVAQVIYKHVGQVIHLGVDQVKISLFYIVMMTLFM